MPRVVFLLHILSLLERGFRYLGKWMKISDFLDIYIGEIARITFHYGRMGVQIVITSGIIISQC